MKNTLFASLALSLHCMKACLGILTMSALGTQVAAQAPIPDIYEGFDYSVGTALNTANATFPEGYATNGTTGANGGTGWQSGWGTGAGDATRRATTAGSLTYSGIAVSGNKLEIEGSRIYRRVATDLTAGNTYYISVLMQKDALDAETGYMGLMLANDIGQEKLLVGSGTGYTHWMAAGNVANGAGFRIPEEHPLYNASQPNALVSNIPNTNLALLVVKIELRAVDAETNPEGLERLTFWLNPDLTKPERDFAALGGQSFSSNSDYGTLRWVRLGGGGTGTAGAKHQVDELRISQNSPFATGPHIVLEEPENTPLGSGGNTAFGKVQLGQPQSRTYTLRNLGNSDLTGLSASLTGVEAGDFQASSLPTSLAPGASATFNVTFTPTVLGTRQAVLTVNSNDPFIPAFTVNLEGEGATPLIVVEQPAGTALLNGGNINLGSSPIGIPTLLTVTLKNDGTLPLMDLSAAVSGIAAEDYSVSALAVTELAEGASTTLTITFTPSAFGVRAATLTISSNDPANGSFVIALTGEGGAPALILEQPAGAPLASGTSSVSFGSTLIGEPVSRTFTLRNDGVSDLEDLAVTLTGSGAASFNVSPLESTELEPQADTSFTVSFSPVSSGSLTATLAIASNDPQHPSFTVTLTGTGMGIYGTGKPVATPELESPLPPADDTGWGESAAGLYDGLLYHNDGSLAGAIETLKIAKGKTGSVTSGAVTGSLRMRGQKVALRGLAVDSTGLLAGTVAHKDGPIQLSLQLRKTTTETPTTVIRGTVTWGGETATADLPQAPYSTKSPVPADQTGTFTLLLPVPDDRRSTEPGGDGWATVTISSSGAVKVTGTLGDGTKFTESAVLSAQGEFALYAELYKTKPEKGRIGGRFIFRNQEGVSDFDGKVQWRKFADAKETAYPQGFDLTRWAVGSRYTAPAAGSYLLSALQPVEPNATLSLWSAQPAPAAPSTTGPGDESVYAVRWNSNHQIVHYGPEKLAARANKGNGILTGSFSSLTGGKPMSLSGVVFQKQNLAAGTFIVPGGSGLLRIKPDADPVFPGSESPGTLAQIGSPQSAAPPPASSITALSANASGIYGGILMDMGGQPVGALENFNLNGLSGTFSAILWYQGIKYPVTGKLESDGSLSGPLSIGTGFALDLHLEQVANGGGLVLKGGLTDGSTTLAIDAQKRQAGLTAKAGSAFTGSYTLAVEGQAGDSGHGYGALTIDFAGLGKGALVLADGSKTTFAGHVSQEGEWSFHRGLYGSRPKGYLTGKLTFRQQAGISDVDGQWRWVKNADALPANFYPGGFDYVCDVIGSRYVKPGKDERAWPALNVQPYYNAWLRLEGANLGASGTPAATALSKVVTWNLKNAILYYGTDKLSLKFNPATGIVTGSYQDRTRGINLAFGGALLQSQSLVAGFYLSPIDLKSGVFVMEPRLGVID